MTISSAGDLAGMRAVGRLVAATLRAMREAVRPGVTTGELDQLAARLARRSGARSAPQLTYAFPGFTCISVNEETVHGIPGARVLAPGDVVKLDVTLELGGFIADAAVTVLVPPATPQARALQRCTRAALRDGIAAARAGCLVREIGAEVEAAVHRAGFAVLREVGGHGVGRGLHEAPSVPNYPAPSASRVLTDGLVLAVEPIVSATPARLVEEADGWTLRTHNRALAAHEEHTIVVRDGVPEVLTAA